MEQPYGERLARLRDRLAAREVDGFFLPRTDEFGSEYLPPSAERVAWLTGFTGSAAQVLVLADKAAVFSDGRYTVQLEQQVDAALFERRHVTTDPPSKWLAEHAAEGVRLGYDPFLLKRAERDRLQKAVAAKGGTLVALVPNPLDEVWTDRPSPPTARVVHHDEAYAGESRAAKCARIGAEIAAKGAAWLVVTSADAIAWLLNIRGRDIPYNPLCLSYVLLSAEGTGRWFVDQRKLSPDFSLGDEVTIEPAAEFLPTLDALTGEAVLVDPQQIHLGYLDRLTAAGARLIEADDPIALAKAAKNAVEVDGARAAHRRDGAAMVRFLAWLEQAARDGGIDEIAAAQQLNLERCRDPLFQGESFPTISAHGPNAALPHYHSEPSTNRRLTPGTVYLVDSGGQYLDATTDITRTIALGEVGSETKERFTLVLKGHIAIAQAVFPDSTNGGQLDVLARLALWRQGLDFDHGTGHGVGSYLCVHEGPQRISKQGGGANLAAGMIVSNEPAYYKAGEYGIRIENLVVVASQPAPLHAERALFGFETLTLCPIDRRMIVVEMLTTAERRWLDAYHARVARELMPLVDDRHARDWLAGVCQPL